MQLKFKRDETSINPPGPDQVAVGEIVINSVTGRLYTKNIAGEIIEYIGQKLCFQTMPEISFFYKEASISENIDAYCCAGDLIVAEITNLKPDPAQYTFDVVELTNNTVPENIALDSPQYRNYTSTLPGVDGGDPIVTELRKATVPISLKVNPVSYDNISIFKFVVYLNGARHIEALLTLNCLEAS